MAVSGAAFRRAWQQGDGGNVDLMYFSPLPDEHLFRAIGWSYRVVDYGDRQAMIEGCYREPNWYTDGLTMVMVLTDRIERPTEAQTLRDTLQLALTLGIAPLLQEHGCASGIAANLAYADALEDSSNFPSDNDEQKALESLEQALEELE